MVVVTGGAGFIGSALIHRLNQNGIDKILIFDSFYSSKSQVKWKNLSGLKFHDVFDKSQTFDVLSETKIDVIFHLGAKTSTTEEDFGVVLRENYEFSKKLFLLSLEKKSKFVYASSAATYGSGENGFRDNEKELEKLKPLNSYAMSKHLFDLWLYRNGYLKYALGIKYFNVFGPGEYHKGEMRSFVSKAYDQITQNGYVRLFKSFVPEIPDGEQKRDFIYVKDAVDITFYLFEKGYSGIFNCGTGKAHSFNELVKAVFSALHKEPKIEYFDTPENIKKQYQNFTEADISKLVSTGYDVKKLWDFEGKVKEYVSRYLIYGKTIGEV
ncbi:MAG: ADP-glyceromanno-heptose 6-epimerase [Candidatus Calescibacterium sp.]|nr:ADP-glyceromanno-heptose 6-epimerase [Candidatus Calescibacterium sp.]MCX7733513.1 ADP-glyceromanno-heptose 6-epimerase [bacterium]MDW8087226.1 ADP-glyceromanno-heptose 6-epimerase [Candidatus Calescibacterium sp.]